MKIIPLLLVSLLGGILLPATASAAVLVNDASIYNADWATEDLGDWTTQSATGANGISVTGGYLVLDNTNATAGNSTVSIPSPVADIPADYIYTVRANVVQFPTAANTGNSTYLAQLRLSGGGSRRNLLSVAVQSNQILVLNNTLYTAIPIVTLEDTFYTWQFQVSMLPASTSTDPAGTVDIYRRQSDTDAWTLVGEDIIIGSSSAEKSAVVLSMAYNAQTPSAQGIVEQDYFQLGVAAAIPEPSSSALLLLPLFAGGIAFWRKSRRTAV